MAFSRLDCQGQNNGLVSATAQDLDCGQGGLAH